MATILNVSFDSIKPFVCSSDIDKPVNFLFMKIDGKAVFERIKKELATTGKSHEWFCVEIGYKPEDYSQICRHEKALVRRKADRGCCGDG